MSTSATKISEKGNKEIQLKLKAPRNEFKLEAEQKRLLKTQELERQGKQEAEVRHNI